MGASQQNRTLDEIKVLGQTDKDAALRQATEQFEALFVQMMLKTMRTTVGESSFTSGNGIKTFQDMQDTEMAKRIAAQGGLGLTDQIIESVMRQAGVKSDAEATDVKGAVNTVDHLQNRNIGSN